MKELLRRFLLLVTAAAVFVCGFCCSCGETVTPAGASIILTDCTGHTVTLEKPAERVVSGYYVTTYAMLALGQAEKLCGIEKKAETRPIYRACAPSLLSLPGIGTMKSCDAEAIAALCPDLVLLPAKLSDTVEIFEKVGIPVLYFSPETQEGLEEMLHLIGKACGAEESADALCTYYEETYEKLEGLLSDTEPVTVCLCGNSSFLTAAPAGMYQNGLIEAAGGVNAAGMLGGDYWAEISYESFLAMDPDAVILPAGAAYTVSDFCADEQLSALSCVKNGRVYAMPSAYEEWDSPIPSGVLGALWMASVLHPDVYPPALFYEDMTGFYQTFYGFTPDVPTDGIQGTGADQ